MRRRRFVTVPEVSTPLSPAESVQLKPPRRSGIGTVIGHTGFSVARYHSTAVFGAVFPLGAGLLFFGWRAGLALLVVLASTAVAGWIWRRIGKRGHPLRPAQLLWLALVLGLMLPAELATRENWPLLPSAALLLVIFSWTVGSFCPGRLHPTVAVFLLLALMYRSQLMGHAVLQSNHVLTGDLALAAPTDDARSLQLVWRRRPHASGVVAIRTVPPALAMIDFTTNHHGDDSLEDLLRERLAPLEDLVLGASPGPIGATSVIAIVVGGLFLLYRGLIDFRIPLLITLTAWIMLLILPLPGISAERTWSWMPGNVHGVGWDVGVTFANYQVLGSPLLFTAFFLAGSPTVRPLARRGRTVYAILIGLMSAAFQLYVSVALGSYLALLIAGLLTPALDRFLAAKPLV
jgi:Na+-translocating ferredoxin:NAD+ oxidoreductase RnfD subunit